MTDVKEIWKDIKGYEGKYQVSTLGRVWSVKTQRYLKQREDKDGYLMVTLYAVNGKAKTEKVHRLVAIAFLNNADHKPQVNHKDENKQNNAVNNLQWVTGSENVNYGTRNTRASKALSKKIYCEELNQVFNSQSEAAEALNLQQALISAVCTGKQKTTGGYHFSFVGGDAIVND